MDPEQNPWKTLGSRAVYRNPWITVRGDQVIRPDGAPTVQHRVHIINLRNRCLKTL